MFEVFKERFHMKHGHIYNDSYMDLISPELSCMFLIRTKLYQEYFFVKIFSTRVLNVLNLHMCYHII